MLNILVSSQLLRHSLRCENYFQSQILIWFIGLLFVSLALCCLFTATNRTKYCKMILILWCVIAGSLIMFCVMSPAIRAHDQDMTLDEYKYYQKRMLKNNASIKHEKKRYRHFHEMKMQFGNKQQAKYGHKAKTTKHHLKKLANYNKAHKNLEYIPKFERTYFKHF